MTGLISHSGLLEGLNHVRPEQKSAVGLTSLFPLRPPCLRGAEAAEAGRGCQARKGSSGHDPTYGNVASTLSITMSGAFQPLASITAWKVRRKRSSAVTVTGPPPPGAAKA
jgi:hypothetical protein